MLKGLKPEVSLPIGLAVAAVVYGIYSNMTPTIAEIRHAEPQDSNIAASRKAATWTSTAVVAGISLIADDVNIFIIGSFMVIGMDFFTRHANEVDPVSGVAATRSARDQATQAGYTASDADFAPAFT